jgi:hypothetical protein
MLFLPGILGRSTRSLHSDYGKSRLKFWSHFLPLPGSGLTLAPLTSDVGWEGLDYFPFPCPHLPENTTHTMAGPGDWGQATVELWSLDRLAALPSVVSTTY